MQIQRLLSRVDDGTLTLRLGPSFNNRLVEVVVLALDEEEQESAQRQPRPGSAGLVQILGDIPSTDDHACNTALLAVAAENRELWRRLRMLRDAIRLVDWHHMQYDHPEMGDWFND